MKLDLTQTLKLLDGVTPLKMDAEGKEEMTLGKIISNILVTSQSRTMEAYKKYSLALKITNQNEVDLDDADIKGIEQVIKDEQRPAIVTGQIQAMIEAAKIEYKKEIETKKTDQ